MKTKPTTNKAKFIQTFENKYCIDRRMPYLFALDKADLNKLVRRCEEVGISLIIKNGDFTEGSIATIYPA